MTSIPKLGRERGRERDHTPSISLIHLKPRGKDATQAQEAQDRSWSRSRGRGTPGSLLVPDRPAPARQPGTDARALTLAVGLDPTVVLGPALRVPTARVGEPVEFPRQLHARRLVVADRVEPEAEAACREARPWQSHGRAVAEVEDRRVGV